MTLEHLEDGTWKGLPGLRESLCAIQSIHEDSSNARSHDSRNIEAIAASLDRLGQHRLAVVTREDAVIRVGNGMVAAAKSLGWTHIAVLWSDESPKEAAARAIADNRTAELAECDKSALLDGIEFIGDDAFIGSIGFTPEDIGLLAGNRSEAPEGADKVPEVKTFVNLGETWVLGRHRLRCGDSTNIDDVNALLGDAKPPLMVTDPPYGVEYDASKRATSSRTGKVMNDDVVDWSNAWNLFPGSVAYCWSAPGGFLIESGSALIKSGFEIRSQIIWKKPRLVLSRGNYHYHHEPCWYAVRPKGKSLWVGDRKQSSVWDVSYDENAIGGHSTQKPVELFLRAMSNHKAESVYEPFAGSGTAVIAAETKGIRCFAMELSENYCSVVIRRWEEFTGEKAAKESG